MRKFVAGGFGLALAVAGCSDSTGPGGRSNANVTFSAKRVGTVSPSLAPSQNVIVTSGTNTINISAVAMTLQDIDMERTSQSVDCTDGTASHQDCSDWLGGPFRVNLNLSDASAGHTVTIPLQAGTYDVISFDISVPDGGDPAEVAYLAANPDMRNASLIVSGTYNGASFTYRTDVRGDREVALNPPITVSADSETTFSFNVQFDVANWFRRSDGSLIDPRSASETDQERIRQNVRNFIESGSRR